MPYPVDGIKPPRIYYQFGALYITDLRLHLDERHFAGVPTGKETIEQQGARDAALTTLVAIGTAMVSFILFVLCMRLQAWADSHDQPVGFGVSLAAPFWPYGALAWISLIARFPLFMLIIAGVLPAPKLAWSAWVAWRQKKIRTVCTVTWQQNGETLSMVFPSLWEVRKFGRALEKLGNRIRLHAADMPYPLPDNENAKPQVPAASIEPVALPTKMQPSINESAKTRVSEPKTRVSEANDDYTEKNNGEDEAEENLDLAIAHGKKRKIT